MAPTGLLSLPHLDIIGCAVDELWLLVISGSLGYCELLMCCGSHWIIISGSPGVLWAVLLMSCGFHWMVLSLAHLGVVG